MNILVKSQVKDIKKEEVGELSKSGPMKNE